MKTSHRASAAARIVVLGALAGLAACATLGIGAPSARATLEPRSGSAASGEVKFTQVDGKLRLAGEIRGLRPNSNHGFHVHENGDCSAADATSAGGHFNPAGVPHGQMGAGAHHAGDLPNLVADARGVARVDLEVSGLSLSAGDRTSVLNRALVVHRDPDDYRSQPAGNSGARIACGVIRAG